MYGRGGEHFLVDPDTGASVSYDIGPRVDGFSFSPDRSEMALAIIDEDDADSIRLFLAQPDGTVVRQLAGDDGNALHPQWEPDGRRVAFSGKTGPDRSDWDVFLVDVDTGNLERITENPGADWVGAWSPDGEHLVILSEYDEDWDVFTIRPNGDDRVRITCTPGNSRYASWTAQVVE